MSYTSYYEKLYSEKKTSLSDCLNLIQSGDTLWCSNNYNEPGVFFSRLHEIVPRVENVFVFKSRIGNYPFMTMEGIREHLSFGNYFYGPNYKKAHELGNCTYFPVDLPNYYKNTSVHRHWNVFVARVGPLSDDGMFYIGMNKTFEEELVRDALNEKKTIILEVNKELISMRGAVGIPIEAVTAIFEADAPADTTQPIEITRDEELIGQRAAEIIEDGDTIQMGIGGIPNAIGNSLMEKKDLGLHTEQFTSSMGKLIEAGVITGSRKAYDKGLHVGVFADGTAELYEYLRSNPQCVLRAGSEVVNPFNIARQDHMVSINTCIEMDITGQICAESIGPRQFSGSGGGFCFTLGCYYAEHGKSIMAFTSRTKKGMPKIKSILTPGAVVTHPRNYVDYVITEFGTVRLKGAGVDERARLLISIAHPDDRPALYDEAKKLGYIH
ncbi:MAG: hypothetical protein MJ067_00650 [Oscillospiraceae bacterium]|nr:hypothetical protein [Oscillospiraceae bacterium]